MHAIFWEVVEGEERQEKGEDMRMATKDEAKIEKGTENRKVRDKEENVAEAAVTV